MHTPDEPRRALLVQRKDTVALIERLRGDVAEIIAGAADGATDDEHDPEGATIGFERAQALALLHSTEHRLIEIDAGLARPEGEPVLCATCRQPIDPARLAVRPSAAECIDCARKKRS